ncbi:hypothetical protein SHKM778_50590 [Streptomyces sp. KM77-8]|uniref:VWA domain-containing protein n=1 Tax=Streptomyces haneummycinicus TaxID=3074435 RepID=A0AAT9HMD1_9ACTN
MDLLRTVLRHAGGLPEARLAALRPLVRRLVDALTRQLATRLRPALHGTVLPRPSRRPGGGLDLPRTLRANLATARRTPDGTVRVIPEHPVFRTRARKAADWRLVLVTDVSGSMEASTVWAALTASVLAGVPTLSTHFLAFSTEVIDLTGHVDDPLSLLLEVSVGGGTHIAAGLRHARELVTVPSRTLVVVVSDFEEGYPLGGLLAEVRALVGAGCHVLGCASLDDTGRPRYSTGVAGQLVAAGMPVAALSPLELARWVGRRSHEPGPASGRPVRHRRTRRGPLAPAAQTAGRERDQAAGTTGRPGRRHRTDRRRRRHRRRTAGARRDGDRRGGDPLRMPAGPRLPAPRGGGLRRTGRRGHPGPRRDHGNPKGRGDGTGGTRRRHPGQRAAARAVFDAAAAVLEAGTDGAGAVLQAELLQAAHTARLAGLPRACASAVSVVTGVRAARSADPGHRLTDLAGALAAVLQVAHRLPHATGPDLTALRGTVRQPYRPDGSLRLYGLFSEPVLTATGYAGAVTWTADADGRLYTVSDVAPGGPARATGAADRAVRVGDTALTHRELSRAGLAVSGATVSPTGRLGAGAGVRAVRASGAAWRAEPLDRLWTVPAGEQVARALSGGQDLLFLEVTLAGPVREATGDCVLADCAGLPLRLVTAHDDPALPYRDNLRLLAAAGDRRLRIVARLAPDRPRGPCCSPPSTPPTPAPGWTSASTASSTRICPRTRSHRRPGPRRPVTRPRCICCAAASTRRCRRPPGPRRRRERAGRRRPAAPPRPGHGGRPPRRSPRGRRGPLPRPVRPAAPGRHGPLRPRLACRRRLHRRRRTGPVRGRLGAATPAVPIR